MAFDREEDLRKPVAGWLSAAGYEVCWEVPIAGRRADLLGWRSNSLVAVELKLEDWPKAFRQALTYQLFADFVWIAVPLATAASGRRLQRSARGQPGRDKDGLRALQPL